MEMTSGGNPKTKDGYYFIHIPKNAGTAICKYLLNNNQIGHYKILDYNNKIHNKTFAVIRCPVDRMISCYNYFKMEKNYWHDSMNHTKHKLYDFCNNHTFEEFVDSVCSKKIDVNHLDTQVSYLKNKEGKIVSNLIRFDNLNEDLSKLFKREINIPIVNPSTKNKIEISLETREKIINHYKEDWELFNSLNTI